MYQALYRKWRPKTFSEVVGQAHITTTLQRQVAEGKTAHAYLFTGSRGTGKTTCARILAKAVNCLDPIDGAPCCRCEACTAIDAGRALDVTELDAASNNGVDQVRALREEAVYTPNLLRKRVYIIDEVHMLSTAAFNALLKILEEPPEHLLFILATTELHKVPATILSRCQRFAFRRILPRDIEAQLQTVAKAEDIPLTADGAEILSRMANGALRDALSLLDQCRVAEGAIDSRAVRDVLGLAGSVQTQVLMGHVLRRDAAAALALFDELYRGGKDVAALLGELGDLGRDMTVHKAAPKGGDALLSGLYDRKTLESLGADVTLRRALYITSALQACCAALPDSFRPRTDAELCLLRLTDESMSSDTGALEGRVARLEELMRKGVPAAKGSRPAPAVKAQPPEEAPPPPDEPPLPEEPGERIYDVPDERPAPSKKVKAAPEKAEPNAAPAGGDTALWADLLDQYKGRLPVNYRVFLNMASGTVEGDCLTVSCSNDFVKTSLDNPTVLDVLRQVTEAALGRSIRVLLQVGAVPQKRAKTAPQHTPAPAAVSAPPSSQQAAPVESPARDKLDELIEKSRELQNFQIKGE